MIKTVAVDFDGVIHDYRYGWADGTIYGDITPDALYGLGWLMHRYAVYVHTTRNARQVARWIEQRSGYGIECTTQMRPWLPPWWQWGKACRFWNQQDVLLVTNRKLPAIAYVDDRAIRFESWDQVIKQLDGAS